MEKQHYLGNDEQQLQYSGHGPGSDNIYDTAQRAVKDSRHGHVGQEGHEDVGYEDVGDEDVESQARRERLTGSVDDFDSSASELDNSDDSDALIEIGCRSKSKSYRRESTEATASRTSAPSSAWLTSINVKVMHTKPVADMVRIYLTFNCIAAHADIENRPWSSKKSL